jgi:hypothetical protein
LWLYLKLRIIDFILEAIRVVYIQAVHCGMNCQVGLGQQVEREAVQGSSLSELWKGFLTSLSKKTGFWSFQAQYAPSNTETPFCTHACGWNC